MKIILQDQGNMQADVEAAADDIERKDELGTLGPEDDLKFPEVAMDDSGFASVGFVSLEIGGVSVASVHIEDLYPAVLAFKKRYDMERK